MIRRLTVPALVLTSIAAAQGSFPGVGVLTHGAGEIGAHSGEQFDFRFYASANGIYDTGLQPFAVDPSGHLEQINGLAGEEFALGAYGVHDWKHAELGLDYRGSYRHYDENGYLDGSDQSLQLGYSYQPTRKITIDMRAIGGTTTYGLTGPATNYSSVSDSVVTQPTLLLFDARTYYLESGMDATYQPNVRTTISVGGSGYFIDHHAAGLVNVKGYNLHGSLLYRPSRNFQFGGEYNHQHYDYPGNFGQADIDTYMGRLNRDFGKRWSASLGAGVFTADVTGIQTVSFDPVITALLGVPSGLQAFTRHSIYPSADLHVVRRFKSAQLSLAYMLGVTPGNGVYLSSRQENGNGTFSYTGISKWSFSVGGIYAKMTSLAQGLAPYTQKSGSVGATYLIMKSLNATARFDTRDQTISTAGYLRYSYRASVGLSFSPGSIPLSLW